MEPVSDEKEAIPLRSDPPDTDESDDESDIDDDGSYTQDTVYYNALYDSAASSPSTQIKRRGLDQDSGRRYPWYRNENGISVRGPLLKGRPIPENEEHPLYGQDTVKLKVEKHHEYKKCIVVSVLTYKLKYNRKYKFYGLKHTLRDFLQKWETDFGVDWEKSGWHSAQKVNKLTQIIENNSHKINITMDTQLVELINTDIEWHSFKPGFENNKVITIRRFNEEKTNDIDWLKQPHESYGVHTICDLNDFTKHNINAFKWCLIKRGWVLIKFPDKYKDGILSASSCIEEELNKYYKYMHSMDNDMKMKKSEWKHICNSFGFTNFKDYKSVFRVFTKDMMRLFAKDYPQIIVDSIKVISDIMDDIAVDIINKTSDLWQMNINMEDDDDKSDVKEGGIGCPDCTVLFEKRIFGENVDIDIKIDKEYEWLESYNKSLYYLCECLRSYNNKVSMNDIVYHPKCKCFHKTLIPLLCIKCVDRMEKEIAFKKTELCLKNNLIKFGMIDFVLYKNKMEINDKKYEMLSNDLNVESHIDPGLFSISFYQNETGLQLVDKTDDDNYNPWIEMPRYTDGVYGVLWTGQYAKERDKQCETGIHRVVYNDNKPRFTAWYEVCINKQIANEVFQEAKTRIQ